MKPRISRRDLNLLSQYMDGQLKPTERLRFESRLLKEPALQEILEDMRKTRLILRSVPRYRAPRKFTLSAQPLPTRLVSRLAPAMGFVSALASLFLIMVLAGDLLGLFLPARSISMSEPAAREVMVGAEQPVVEQSPVGQTEVLLESSARGIPTSTASVEPDYGDTSSVHVTETAPMLAAAAPASAEVSQAKEAPMEADSLESETELMLETPEKTLAASIYISGTETLTSTLILEVQSPAIEGEVAPPMPDYIPSPSIVPAKTATESVLYDSEIRAEDKQIIPDEVKPSEEERKVAPLAKPQPQFPIVRWILWIFEAFLALVALIAGAGAVITRHKANQ